MNFLNFLTSGANLFNFNFQDKNAETVRQNTILVEPQNSIDRKPAISPHSLDSVFLNGVSKKEDRQGEQLEEVLKNQEILINQYLQLNIKYFESQLNQNNRVSAAQIQKSEDDLKQKQNSFKKKIMKLNKCGHEDKSHYAKGMCNNCYHKYGRTKKPWNCSHSKLYAAGMCQNCYINNYNRKKREEKQSEECGNIEKSEQESHQDIKPE